MRGSLLIAGTSSDAGKSVVVAGICRLLSRRGVAVAPFKAQNMSLNSAVTRDGAEIGRAQAAQAAAARVEPEAAMNPVLLKPGARSTQVVVLGHPLSDYDARSYQELRRELLPVVIEALDSLCSRFDVVICEGAGSLAEINLRDGDLVNMGLARRAGLPTVVVADIDRGGALAGLFGSLAVLDREDQALVGGFLLNKFRGDHSILEPGLHQLSSLTGRPVLGVLPWVPRLWLDAEDSVALDGQFADSPSPLDRAALSVAVVRFPRISNFTDVDALATEPGVAVTFTQSPKAVLAADLVVLPGTKATVEDLNWLRTCGLADALQERSSQGHPLFGICGGYQMLGKRIMDYVESGAGEVAGLDLLPAETTFAADKHLSNRVGRAPAWGDSSVTGYEIRHGRTTRFGGQPLLLTDDGDEGCVQGTVVGASWHGAFESDDFRRAILGWVSEIRRLGWRPGSHSFEEVRQARLDSVGDLIEDHVDIDALFQLIERGTPKTLPRLQTQLHASNPCEVSFPSGAPPSLDLLRAHGDAMVPTGYLDFAVNVVPGGPTDWLRRELAGVIEGLGSYPDERDAIHVVADRHRRPSSEVLTTNGAAEAFWLIALAFRPRSAVVIHPTFTESDVALRTIGLPVEQAFRSSDDFSLDPSVVPEDADVVFVCNPNNPTGNLERADVIARLERPDRVVVIDESFMEFCPGEAESFANRSDAPGVIVIRSVTKLWSLAGIRAGYLLGQADLIDRLRSVRQPWAVNTMALAALVACTRRGDAAEAIALDVALNRDELIRGLQEIAGIRVWPSRANFLLIEVPDGPGLTKGLLDRKIAVRRAHTFPGLSENHLRVAVRGPEDSRVLLTALKELIT